MANQASKQSGPVMNMLQTQEGANKFSDGYLCHTMLHEHEQWLDGLVDWFG